MIFVTVGTQDKPFTRLLENIEKQIELGNINDTVYVQAGYTKYSSEKMKIFDFIEDERFKAYIKDSDLIITHGGVGSILTALSYKKKVIAVPRLSKYGEHVNDHQLQILKCFEEKGYLLPVYDFANFSKILLDVKDFIPNEFLSNNQNFIEYITKIIEE